MLTTQQQNIIQNAKASVSMIKNALQRDAELEGKTIRADMSVQFMKDMNALFELIEKMP